MAEQEGVRTNDQAISEASRDAAGLDLSEAVVGRMRISPLEAGRILAVTAQARRLFQQDAEFKGAIGGILFQAKRVDVLERRKNQAGQDEKEETKRDWQGERRKLEGACGQGLSLMEERGIHFPQVPPRRVLANLAVNLTRLISEEKRAGRGASSLLPPEAVLASAQTMAREFLMTSESGQTRAQVLVICGSCALLLALLLQRTGNLPALVSAPTVSWGVPTPEIGATPAIGASQTKEANRTPLQQIIEEDKKSFVAALNQFAQNPNLKLTPGDAGFEILKIQYGITENDLYWLRNHPGASKREIEAQVEKLINQNRIDKGGRVVNPDERAQIVKQALATPTRAATPTVGNR